MTGYPSVAGYLIYFVLSAIAVFTLYLFYMIWLYIKSTSRIASGTDDMFMQDEEVGGGG